MPKARESLIIYIKNGLLRASSSESAALEKEHGVPRLHIDSLRRRAEAQLNSRFGEEILPRRLEGRNYKRVDFSSIVRQGS